MTEQVAVEAVVESEIAIPVQPETWPAPPRKLLFTLKGNPNSAIILERMHEQHPEIDCRVFDSSEDLSAYLETEGVDQARVALFDERGERRYFRIMRMGRMGDVHRTPTWAKGAYSILMIFPNAGKSPYRVVFQLSAYFVTKAREHERIVSVSLPVQKRKKTPHRRERSNRRYNLDFAIS